MLGVQSRSNGVRGLIPVWSESWECFCWKRLQSCFWWLVGRITLSLFFFFFSDTPSSYSSDAVCFLPFCDYQWKCCWNMFLSGRSWSRRVAFLCLVWAGVTDPHKHSCTLLQEFSPSEVRVNAWAVYINTAYRPSTARVVVGKKMGINKITEVAISEDLGPLLLYAQFRHTYVEL